MARKEITRSAVQSDTETQEKIQTGASAINPPTSGCHGDTFALTLDPPVQERLKVTVVGNDI